MNSSRPYLLRAIYEWIVDNNCTPYISVHTDYPGLRVPPGYDTDGVLTLNISPSAVRQLHMGNDELTFSGRFGGVPQSLLVPTGAVLGIYARENGQGMFFELETPGPDDSGSGTGKSPAPPSPAPASKRPSLKVVK